MEGVKDLEVLIEEGIASVVVRQVFLLPATRSISAPTRHQLVRFIFVHWFSVARCGSSAQTVPATMSRNSLIFSPHFVRKSLIRS